MEEIEITKPYALWNVLQALSEESWDMPETEYQLLLQELIDELKIKLDELKSKNTK